jgi:indole-3-glycerol phosphate synthase
MMTLSHSVSAAVGRVFLEDIVKTTRVRIARLASQRTFDSLLAEGQQHVRRSLITALQSNPPAIIAEVKKASPSKGVLCADFDHLRLATAYDLGGAAALSIVTEPEFFQGHDDWISQVRTVTAIPVLRKDFVLAPIQVAEAAALGADAILLIARILSAAQMRELHDAADLAQLDVLYEAHDEDDLTKIAECRPLAVGINARNLDTFIVDTSQFDRLRSLIPNGAVAIAESGIESPDQIAAAMELGYQGFLIGESLVKSSDPRKLISQLRSGVVK